MTRREILATDKMIRELEELAELAADVSGDEGRTAAMRKSYAHAARLARAAQGRSGGLKPAEEYAELVRFALGELDEDDLDGHNDGWLKAAQVHATCTLAAATLEAARLTLDAQASNLLSALEEPEPGAEYVKLTGPPGPPCRTTWTDEETGMPPTDPRWPSKIHPDEPHSCSYGSTHPDDPHYCRCGAEL